MWPRRRGLAQRVWSHKSGSISSPAPCPTLLWVSPHFRLDFLFWTWVYTCILRACVSTPLMRNGYFISLPIHLKMVVGTMWTFPHNSLMSHKHLIWQQNETQVYWDCRLWFNFLIFTLLLLDRSWTLFCLLYFWDALAVLSRLAWNSPWSPVGPGIRAPPAFRVLRVPHCLLGDSSTCLPILRFIFFFPAIM